MGSWSLSQHHWTKAGYTLDNSLVHYRADIYKLPFKLTFTPTHLVCMFLDCGKKQERTHTNIGRTCKLLTERPQPKTYLQALRQVLTPVPLFQLRQPLYWLADGQRWAEARNLLMWKITADKVVWLWGFFFFSSMFFLCGKHRLTNTSVENKSVLHRTYFIPAKKGYYWKCAAACTYHS